MDEEKYEKKCVEAASLLKIEPLEELLPLLELTCLRPKCFLVIMLMIFHQC